MSNTTHEPEEVLRELDDIFEDLYAKSYRKTNDFGRSELKMEDFGSMCEVLKKHGLCKEDCNETSE